MLEGKVALVTGGESGIGRSIVLKFVEQGAKVVIFGLNQELGSQVVAEIQKACGEDKASFYRIDVSNSDEVNNGVQQVLDTCGHIDILVNNAGITRDGLLMRMKQEDWDAVLKVNLKSCFNMCQAVMRPMIKARSGKIINMASVVGLMGNAGQVNYAASKAGVIGFSKSLAKEVAARNVCVNCIAPGYIDTMMTQALSDQQREAVVQQIPIGRLGQPEDVATVAVFLASEWSAYITGQVITVDGGMVM